jgi:hypothetical protein
MSSTMIFSNRAGEANRIVREAPPSPPSGGASSCGGEFIFKQVWSQIVPRHYPLSPDLGNTYKQKLVRSSVPSSREE